MRRGQGELMGLMGLMAAKKGVNLFGLLPFFFFFKIPIIRGKETFFSSLCFFLRSPNSFFLTKHVLFLLKRDSRDLKWR